MTNAAIQKKLDRLQAEIKLLRRTGRKRPDLSIDEKIWRIMRPVMKEVRTEMYSERYGARQKSKMKSKPLPKWLQASLKDIEEGRTSGPFDTVEELMADLNGPGK